jgi:hypothetical protein
VFQRRIRNQEEGSMKPITLVALVLGGLVFAAPNALAADRDHDGLPDRWEHKHHLSTTKKSANGDPDRDRVDNGNELREGTNPRDRDSDNDGRPDGREDRDRDHLSNAAEDRTANDPRDRDTDDDGIEDGAEQAGVVASFEDGVLVIDLANGGEVSGRVTADTEIECEGENEAEHHHGEARTADRGPGSGDDSSGEGQSGSDDRGDDDRGDDERGDDQGEDRRDDDACPSGALAAGARVHEAELRVSSSGAVWEEVELIR